MEDPYFRIRDEVEENMQSCEQQVREFDILRTSSQNIQRAEYAKAEIENKLASIRKSLIDIEKMNSAVIANPGRFNISQVEIDNRRTFISQTRNRVSQVEAKLSAPISDPAQARAAAQRDKYTKARIADNQRAIDNEIENQQIQLRRQDEDLDMIGNETATIGVIANQIHDELRDQNSKLGQINDHMDNSILKLETTTDKMKKLLSSKTTWMWVVCVILTILLIILIIYTFLQ